MSDEQQKNLESDNNKERQVIGVCSSCRFPIHEREAIYCANVGKSKITSYGPSVSYGNSFTARLTQPKMVAGFRVNQADQNWENEEWVLCSYCYDQWQEELSNLWYKWDLPFRIIAISSYLLMTAISAALIFKFKPFAFLKSRFLSPQLFFSISFLNAPLALGFSYLILLIWRGWRPDAKRNKIRIRQK